MRIVLSVLVIAVAASAGPVAGQGTSGVAALVTFAAQGPVQELKPAYEKTRTVVTFDTSPNITRRLATGETPDVLVAQTSTIDEMVKAGRAVATTRKALGRIGVGVAVGKGSTTRPDISSADALKASILKADAIVYSRGASGLLVEDMLKKIGVADQVKAKAVQVATGADVMQRLGESGHGNQVGFTMVSEIKLGESHGGTLVGPLPAAVQTYTPYEAVIMSTAKNSDAAKQFIATMTTPAARKVFAAAGWN